MTINKTPELIDKGPDFETAGLIHRVHRPDGDGPHPTAVLLHGLRGNEDVMWVFQRALPSDWLVVAPRAIKSDPVSGYAWHPRQPDEWPTLRMFDEAVSVIHHFIDSLPILYGADPGRVYLVGFSQGAAAAFAVAVRYPKLVQGISGLVGFTPENWEIETEPGILSGLPIFMAVGIEDETIPIERSRKSAEVLRRAGANLTYCEFETGHKLNAEGMKALKQWFFER